MKKIFIAFLITLFTLTLIECGAWITVKIFSPPPVNHFRILYQQNANGDQSIVNKVSNIFKERTAHPYFGFAFSTSNNYGLLENHKLPYKAAPDEFVIGIFGGSTAACFADYIKNSKVWDKLKSINPKKNKIIVLNLSLPGGRQPAQFIIGSFFLEHLDAAVLVDGWNEMVIDANPIEYPEGYDVLYSRENNTEVKAQLYFHEKKWRLFNYLLSESFLARSSVVYLIWLNFKSFHLNQVVELRNKFKRKSDDNIFHVNDDLQKYNNWKKFYTYFKALAQIHEVPVFQFFQPNHINPGAKPFSEIEKRYLTTGQQTIFYNLYLENLDPTMTDLSNLFKDTKETVFIDPYTHLNELGYNIMAGAIEKKMIKAKVVTRK